MIIYANDSQKVKWPDSDKHDPDSEKYYYISYYPDSRANSKAYTKGVDVVVPSVNNGCMYECVSGGISDTSETTFPTVENGNHEDGDVTWKCKPLTTLLGDGDTITSSTWVGDTGVVLANDAIVDNIITEVQVTSVADGASKFEITNEIEVLYANGKTEARQKTLIIKVKEL